MKKIFDENGELTLRFADNANEQIIKWLDGIDYDYALKFAKKINCPVFGLALEFPCRVENTSDQIIPQYKPSLNDVWFQKIKEANKIEGLTLFLFTHNNEYYVSEFVHGKYWREPYKIRLL